MYKLTKNQQIELTNLLYDKFLFEPNDRKTRNKVAHFVNRISLTQNFKNCINNIQIIEKNLWII